MSVDVRRVTDVIARSLEPADEIDLQGRESAVTPAPIRTIERNLDGARRRGQRRGSVAVVVVQAFSGRVVVRIIDPGIDWMSSGWRSTVDRTSRRQHRRDLQSALGVEKGSRDFGCGWAY